MKQIYLLIFKSEQNNYSYWNGSFGIKELLPHEAINLNSELTDLIWILCPEN
jgi:hypothetical protein